MGAMRKTIKNHRDFIMGADDATARCAFCIIRARPTHFTNDAQYGLIVTKRTFKYAVHRNRAKRLLREWLRANERMLRPDLDYILIARASILDATRDVGVEALRKALHYLNKTTPVATNNNA